MTTKFETVWDSADQVADLRQIMPPYWTPIIDALEKHGTAVLLLGRSQEPFQMHPELPLITVIGDDYDASNDGSTGPMGFDRLSLLKHFANAEAVTIIAGEAKIEHYAAAASVAVLLRKNSILVETQPQWQSEWLQVALYCGVSRLLVVTPDIDDSFDMTVGGRPN